MTSVRHNRSRRGRWQIAVAALSVMAACLSWQPAWAQPSATNVVTVNPPDQLHIRPDIEELPVPPTAPSTAAGSCTAAVNPHGTGCLSAAWGALGAVGTYYPSSDYVMVGAVLAGAPTTGATAIYSGPQALLVHTDGKTFPNGDAWKCLTCGVAYPTNSSANNNNFTYPINGFHDGKRALAGAAVIDCGHYKFSDDMCTPAQMHAYPLYWDNGTGKVGQLREPRLNPDDTHIGFSYMPPSTTVLAEYAFAGALAFDQANNRYDIDNVRTMYNPIPAFAPYVVRGSTLKFNPAGMIGEFRGWTADGRSALGIEDYDSDSIDLWATDNTTGASHPLTHHAEYTDPNFPSPNGKYLLSEQVLGSGRLDFVSGLQGIPPLTDQLSTIGYVSGIRNNGQRRFFLPWLVDLGSGHSEQVNAGADPNWNAAADPAWLSDSTAAVWAENLVTTPACGGSNPLPCPTSAEPGGRHSRVMIARFDGLAPTSAPQIPRAPDITWGLAYHPGDQLPIPKPLPSGTYTVDGTKGGEAKVVITDDATNALITEIQVAYTDFRNDAGMTVNGTESVARRSDSELSAVTFHENLKMSGAHHGTKVTSEPGGFTLSPAVMENNFQATGTMTTTIDGKTYIQPGNGD
ncbi:hypothetical protein K7711_38175 [Nocardia sp. CA2R105]|uniref:hypothetical protein n=1 Tax=Nocardia coffeae TaxID=2873381 RepID=UPI001CA723BE|nr:hypothetical protein [Nocardia coffeae]MBY8862351.1 hypothetical protein [Nocardia coffeae]